MSRITGGAVAIDADAVQQFFEQRAVRAGSSHPLTSVLYQDHAPDLAIARDAHEKAVALPLLEVDATTHVLDIGCGIGRWADDLAPGAASYCGIDFSPGLIDAARRRVTHPGARFVQLAMQEADPVALGRPEGFDRLLMAGVLIYVNDDDVLRTLHAAASCAAPSSLLYLREPTAVHERLTLDGHWSEEMQCAYSAIYRTHDELADALRQTFGAVGFEVRASAELYPASLNNRTETVQRYHLLERRA